MRIDRPPKKVRKNYWWLLLFGLCFLPCLTPLMPGHQPDKVLAGIPFGSNLSDLDDYIGPWFQSSSVTQWSTEPSPGFSAASEKTKLGTHYIKKLGDHGSWTASKEERDFFTGEVEFSHFCSIRPDDIAPSFWIQLIYVDGKLKEKDWGQYPG